MTGALGGERRPGDEAEDDARIWGLIYKPEEDELTHDGVWAEHLEALAGFLALCTQWRFACPGDGSLRRTGLDYAAARAGLDLAGIAMTPELWSDIRMIEMGAIAASHEEANR